MGRSLGDAYVSFSQRGMNSVTGAATRATGALKGVAGFAGRASKSISLVAAGSFGGGRCWRSEARCGR